MSAIKNAVLKGGGVAALSEEMDVSITTVNNWIKDNHVPANRLIEFEKATGVSRHEISPELFAGYRKWHSKDMQFIPTISDTVFLIASHIIDKANTDKEYSNQMSIYKSAMISLHDVSKALSMNNSVSSALCVWSEMLGSSETKISPIDYDLLLERGSVDPVIIHRTFAHPAE